MPNTYRSKKPIVSQRVSKKELQKKLNMSLLGIFIFIITMIIAINFFGPQLGALFGFISKNKNDEGPKVELNISVPSITNLPEATKNKEVLIEGYATPGSIIKLYVNGPEKAEVLTGGDGKFVFDNVQLIDGRNTIFAKAYDNDGNSTEKSDTKVTTVDTKAPKISVEEPKNGETIRNLNERVLVKGKLNEKASVRINDRLAVVKPDLSFEYLLGISEGGREIKVIATDAAGNQSEEKIFITYIKD